MQKLVPHTTCPVCDCREYTVLATQEQLEYEKAFRDRLYRRKLPDVPESMFDDLTVFTNAYRARLVVCRACGLVCRDPRFSPQGAVQAYSSDDYSEEWLESTFSEYYSSYSSKMPELKRVVGDSARVLEVGSYVGGFLAAARDHGWSALGIDVGSKVSEFSRGKGLQVITGTLFDAHLASSSFDAVLVWDCFDQLPDPRQQLSEMRRLLKPEGWLFVQVPNGEYVRLMEQLARGPLRVPGCKALAYTGMAGFPYQLGYTAHVLTRLLRQSGYSNIGVRNQMDVCDESASARKQIREQTRYLRRIRRTSELLSRVSGNRVFRAPWVLATCRKG